MNIAKLMKQAQDMQKKMAETQENLEHLEVEGQSGGGMVVVRLSGKYTLRHVYIDPSLMVPHEVDVLEDLLRAAFNDAVAKVEHLVAQKMANVTAGISMPPGFKLPF